MIESLTGPVILGLWKLLLLACGLTAARLVVRLMDRRIVQMGGKGFIEWQKGATGDQLAFYNGCRIAGAFIAAGLMLS